MDDAGTTKRYHDAQQCRYLIVSYEATESVAERCYCYYNKIDIPMSAHCNYVRFGICQWRYFPKKQDVNMAVELRQLQRTLRVLINHTEFIKSRLKGIDTYTEDLLKMIER